MHHRVALLVCTIALGLFGAGSTARADRFRYDDNDYGRGDVRLYGGLGIGVGGRAHLDASGPFGIGAGGSDDLITSVGGQVGVDIPVLRYLSLGGEARLLTFNTQALDDHNVDRSKLLDIDFKPRLRLPIRRSPIELYFTTPIGLTVPFLADNFGDNGSTDAKVGWNVGIGGGINWWLTRAFALNFEPMFVIHKFKVDGAANTNADVTLRQFTMFFNAVVAL